MMRGAPGTQYAISLAARYGPRLGPQGQVAGEPGAVRGRGEGEELAREQAERARRA